MHNNNRRFSVKLLRILFPFADIEGTIILPPCLS